MAGFDSYFIYGLQSVDWDTPALTAAMVSKIFEFRNFNLKSASEPIIPTRFRRVPSPTPQIENFIRAEGEVEMDAHADDLVWMFTQLMMDSSISSTDFTALEIYGNGAGAGKAFGASPLSVDTQPTATTPASDPGKLIVTLGAADSGTITITGTDQQDNVISEVLTFVAEAGPKTTTKYFKTVATGGIVYAGITVGVALTMLIKSDMNVYTHVIGLGDALLNGVTIEAVKNGIPSVYIGALLNSMTLDIGDVLGLTWSFLAKRGWNRYKVPAAGTTPTSSNTPTSVAAFSPVGDEVLPAWGLSLTLDAVEVPIASGSFNFSNNLGFPTRYRNLRTSPKPTRQGPRDLSLTVGIDYDTTNADFDAKMLTSQKVAAILYAYRKPYASAEYMLKISLPRCEVRAFPDPSVTDFPEVIQELQLRPIRTAGAVASDECEITLQCVASS